MITQLHIAHLIILSIVSAIIIGTLQNGRPKRWTAWVYPLHAHCSVFRSPSLKGRTLGQSRAANAHF